MVGTAGEMANEAYERRSNGEGGRGRGNSHEFRHGRWILRRLVVVFWLVGTAWFGTECRAEERLQFNRDIRPILSEHCWKCHGFDAGTRAAGLRLDDREAALRPADSGAVAIVPGQPEVSELIERLTTDDESLRMPPKSAAKRPTAAEIATLTRWVEEGATYQRHWSFEPIVKPALPVGTEGLHPVDAFVAARLRSLGRDLAPAADRDTLIRRVHFDLIGLPPSSAELEQARNETYEQTVDRLLASPHFGERMAVDWLDAARYADTDGYFGDKPRQMWLWRDWVIRAFNANMPFDQFTIEQLAGDLLPNATTAQKIATGFNRNHMSNDETGLIDEEYRVEYVADRVDTTMSTWLGLTVGCAQCHDHKYDPLSQREYYQLFAVFNTVAEQGLLLGTDAPPRISVPTPAQESLLAAKVTERAAAEATFKPLREAAIADLAAREAMILAEAPAIPGADGTWVGAVHVPLEGVSDGGTRALGTALKRHTGVRGDALRFDATQHLELDAAQLAVDAAWTFGLWVDCEASLAAPLSKIEPLGDRRGLELLWQRGQLGVNLIHRWNENSIEVQTPERLPTNRWNHVAVRYDGSKQARGVTVFVNGRPAAVTVRRDALTETIANSEPIRLGRRDEGLGFYGSLDEFRWIPAALPDDAVLAWYRGERLRGVLERPADKRPGRDVEWLWDDQIDNRSDQATRSARDAVRKAQAAETAVRASIPLTLVMEEQAMPRATHLLERGAYNKPGERVEVGVPAALSAWPAGAPRNRLGFSQWLVAPDNPLAARVAVNRFWKQCFGEGLVRTVNDFGSQGERPTHPDLLDWLAASFRETWDTKALLRQIVTSQTYKQRSAFEHLPDGELFDPENRLLGRGARFRLPIEMIRDQALVASGLLVPMVGGPSVRPYQPSGLWEEVSYNSEAIYEVDDGPGRYRRSLYTVHKRQSPPPALLVFDGPTREKCTLKRARTNTPLQALVLLNDETYIEASREVALGLLSREPEQRARLRLAVETILSREARAEEIEALARLLESTRKRFAEDVLSARQLARQEESTPGPVAEELAAWMVLVQALFNLDEAVTRR
jgi:hypothetical protein